MRELYGRLADLDPTAGDNLSVIQYFDRLVAEGPSIEVLIKEAAVLAKATIGYEVGSRRYRRLPSGDAAAISSRPQGALTVPLPGGGEAWLSPTSDSPPTTNMVIERLALALALTEARRGEGHHPSSVQVLLSKPHLDEPDGSRTRALGRLRLEPAGLFRAVALPLSVTPPSAAPHALMETSRGSVRAAIVRDGYAATGPAGIGTLATGEDLHRSWKHALIALCIAGSDECLAADDLGPALLSTLEEAETWSHALEPEMTALERALADQWSVEELRAVADGHSLRVVAQVRSLHHSTVDAKLKKLTEILGYDPRTGMGGHRLAIALMIWCVRYRERALEGRAAGIETGQG